MTSDYLEELIIINSVGALDGDDLIELQSVMEDNDARDKSDVWDRVATAIGETLVSHSPSPAVKAELMRRIQELHATERANEGPGAERLEHSRGIHTVFPERMPWSKHPVQGVSFKVLSESAKRGSITMLMKVEPGTVFPEHHHTGEEECYVLSGSITLNGKRLGPGVLHHGDEDSDHGVLTSDEGALLLLVVSEDDYIPPIST